MKALLSRYPQPLLAFNDHTSTDLSEHRRGAKFQKAAERAGVDAGAYGRLLEAAAGRHTEVPAAIDALACVLEDRGQIDLGLRTDLVTIPEASRRPVATIAGGRAVFASA